MIRPFALYIGLRYTRAKRRNHFISFISLASMIGIAIGVMVLITVLSVMNGFDYQIRARFFALQPEVTILSSKNINNYWQSLKQQVKKIPGVAGAAPYVTGNGLFISGNQMYGTQISGIDPLQENEVSKLQQTLVAGSLTSLIPGKFNIVLGKALVNAMGLQIGDTVNLYTTQANMTLAGTFPRYRRFHLVGIFQTSSGFGFETTVAYVNWQDAQKLFPPGVGISGLHVHLTNLYQAEQVSRAIQNLLPLGFSVTNWTIDFGAFFQAFVMEKLVLFIVLLLIVAVAVFNLVATLVMVVHDKRADIAILRTLGATPRMIMMTFIVQGAIIGLVGVILGLIFGLLLAANVTGLANWIQNVFHIQFLSSSVFFIDYVPSRILLSDIVKVCVAAWGLSLLATLYPASVAFRTQPAEALRYE